MKSLKRNIVIAMMMLLILITIPTVSKAYVNYRHGYYHSIVNVNALILQSTKYTTPYRNSMAAWNGATSRIRWGNVNASQNVIRAIDNNTYTWFGIYNAYDLKPNGRAGRFIIRINDERIRANNNFRQSVIVHEMGHALCLDHTTSSTSIMSYNRDRYRIIKPNADDVRGVNYAY